MGKMFDRFSVLKKWWFWTLPVVGALLIGMSVRDHISDEIDPAVKEGRVSKSRPKAEKAVAEKHSKKKIVDDEDRSADSVKSDYSEEAEDLTESTESVSSPASEAVSSTPSTPAVPSDFYKALEDARSYSSLLHMSLQGIYDQLISEYGEDHSAAAAQYAIDNLQADYNYNALQSARSYQEMGMTPEEIREQLISSYGEGFTEAEANYAVSYL
ncbi:Ltp family lipoprotein [Companilactobacillus furfuricola]|uniref:Ltp family lipoprotein n=1 Tax=Companilactobacillus furfuricola TaxID=1462575 RepID=UPI001FE2735B|nr:Ltp family lipoprotein [Companilactobacillus furfuricola]